MLYCIDFLLHWLAICIAASVAFAKSSGSHDTEFRGYISIRNSVCTLPQSQSTVSALYPHSCRLFLVRKTLMLNLSSVSRVFHSLRYPSGSFSIGIILKLLVLFNFAHLWSLSWSMDVVSSKVDFKKFLLDFSLLCAGRCPWSGCLPSLAWAVFWSSLAMHLLILEGGGCVMPARTYTIGMSVGLKHP